MDGMGDRIQEARKARGLEPAATRRPAHPVRQARQPPMGSQEGTRRLQGHSPGALAIRGRARHFAHPASRRRRTTRSCSPMPPIHYDVDHARPNSGCGSPASSKHRFRFSPYDLTAANLPASGADKIAQWASDAPRHSAPSARCAHKTSATTTSPRTWISDTRSTALASRISPANSGLRVSRGRGYGPRRNPTETSWRTYRASTCGQAPGSAGVTPTCGAPPRFVPGVTGRHARAGRPVQGTLAQSWRLGRSPGAGPIPDTPASQNRTFHRPSALERFGGARCYGTPDAPGMGASARRPAIPPVGIEMGQADSTVAVVRSC